MMRKMNNYLTNNMDLGYIRTGNMHDTPYSTLLLTSYESYLMS